MNILAFTFFVILSTFFWFRIAINKNYIETINYPIRFENFPSRRVQVGELPEFIQITVEASGSVILKHKIWSTLDPININVAECTIFPYTRKDTSRFYVLTRLERSRISSQLSSDIRIMDIYPDTLKFNFQFLKIKKLPVIGNVDIHFQKQHMLVGQVHFQPDSLVVSGPSSVIDTLDAIYTEALTIKDASEPINRNIAVQKIPGTDAEKRRLRVIADIDKFTESDLEIPVIPINVPDTLTLKTFPKKVQVNYHVPFKIYEQIKPEDFLITVNFNDIGKENKNLLRLYLDKAPAPIKVLGWEPKFVEFIIEKQ
jgi:hypothetical protein